MTIVNACKKHGIAAGIHANAQIASRHSEAGYQMITISSDTGALAAGTAQDLRSVRGAADATGQPIYR